MDRDIPMDIVQVDVVHTETFERLLEGLRDVLRRAIDGLYARRAPELCGEEYLAPLPSGLQPVVTTRIQRTRKRLGYDAYHCPMRTSLSP